MQVRFLSTQEIVAINVAMIKKYSPDEQIGIKSPSLLESATYRPQASAFGDDAYPTIFHKAAALFESLGKNHAFHNANKRTAFAALVVFLAYNGFSFQMDQKRAENLTVDMVEHKYTFEQLVETIQQHTQNK